jgi:hypothetical protein
MLINEMNISFRAFVNTRRKGVLGFVFFSVLIILFISSCIYPYVPKIDEDLEILSIEGSLIKGIEEQSVIVSGTTTLIYPQFKPLRECEVSIIDNLDNKFVFNENDNGTYTLHIPDNELVLQREYKLRVITPSGKIYESLYERLNNGVDVDSIYYEIESKLDKFSGETKSGIQFYVDLKASDSLSRYYRWKLDETFEYTSVSPVTYIVGGDTLQDQYEFYRCWKTVDIPDLFLSNTINLILNEKKKISLNYVTSETDRLKIKYCLHVEQYTLNETAYTYWQKKRNDTQLSGGIYNQQPGLPVTNIYNLEDSTEQVLGFFWTSNKTDARLFVPRDPGLAVSGDLCELVEYDPRIHKGIRYIYVSQDSGKQYTSPAFCMNCLLKDGSNTPPDFWE